MKQPSHTINLGLFATDRHGTFPTADGHGKTSRVIGQVSGEVEMHIDIKRLARHCQRALLNSRGRSRLAGGAIEFVATHRVNG